MPWARFDDHMPSHRKVRPLSDGAFRLWVSAVCWCNANHTDGTVFYRDLTYVSDVKRPRKYVTELVISGLWEEFDGGWTVHDFLDYNPSSAEVTAARKLKTERQRKWRANRTASDVDASVDASTDGTSDASRDAAPSRPVPSPTKDDSLRSSSTARKRAPATAKGTRVPEDFTVTAEMVAWCRENFPGVDGRAETAAFLDYWRAQPGQRGVKVDWIATWRNWIRRAAERTPLPSTAVARANGRHDDLGSEAHMQRFLQRQTAREQAAGGWS